MENQEEIKIENLENDKKRIILKRKVNDSDE